MKETGGRKWTVNDLLSAGLVFLILVPPLGLVCFIVWGAIKAWGGLKLTFFVLKKDAQEFGKGIRKAWRNFRWDLSAWWHSWTTKKEPGKPTVWTVYEEIISRHNQNCELIRRSPMRPDAKEAALGHEQKVLEDRIEQLLR